MPIQNPITAGTKDHFPKLSDCSIEGSSRLQIEAAVITPAANPVSVRCREIFNFLFIKNTPADPRTVPAKGINNPCITSANI